MRYVFCSHIIKFIRDRLRKYGFNVVFYGKRHCIEIFAWYKNEFLGVFKISNRIWPHSPKLTEKKFITMFKHMHEEFHANEIRSFKSIFFVFIGNVTRGSYRVVEGYNKSYTFKKNYWLTWIINLRRIRNIRELEDALMKVFRTIAKLFRSRAEEAEKSSRSKGYNPYGALREFINELKSIASLLDPFYYH